MTYPQQPYGGQEPYPGYGGPYGGGYGAPPPPPPKKNTAAIVSVVAVVVVLLAGLGITGFVAPGFFRSDDDGTPVGSPTTTTTTSSEPDGDGAETVLAAVADGLDAQETSALDDLACADAKANVSEAIEDARNVTGAELVDTEEVADDEVMGTVEVSVDDEKGEFEVTVTRVDDEWCWQDIQAAGGPATSEPVEPSSVPSGPGGGEPTAGGQPVPSAALAVMQAFLDAVNGGDADIAKGALCADAISTAADVDELVGYDPDLAIDPTMDGNASGAESVQLYLRGTAKDQELDGYSTNLWVTSYDGPWCVHAFRAVVI
ncbi:MAG: hypothetical protein WBA97_10065 [Actinophytocola sp.]|uniref:hypothetical protein n=1 Tax=Actinophytocola sp. TaxID=1872138 RepID=UPI003C796398